MSPVSRGRKGKQSKGSTRRLVVADVSSAVGSCDCPACSGADLDPQQLIDELIAGTADLLEAEDPLDAEIIGAAFVSIGALAGEGFEEALVNGFIPEIEARATPEALAMLLAIGSVTPDHVGKAAWTAADRLVGAGVARPRWAAELAEPMTVTDCWHLADPQGSASILACSFHRAGRSHAVMISVDHTDCGAASDILLLDTAQLPEMLAAMQATASAGGLAIRAETLDGAEFRWQAEKALDARGVHDSEDGFDEDLADPPVDEDGPGYPALAVLMRARMNVLPVPTKPAALHADSAAPSPLQMLTQLTQSGSSPFVAGIASAGSRSTGRLPAKRKKSAGPAPVYQIKVGLRGAKPPIWRRLQMSADISLARLHEVIQVAFGWEDSHLHVFETPYGNFGTADAELGHRAEAPVTLEQVAPAVNDKISYTYDFGDNWDHDILIEKVLDRDQKTAYPRCTGGRRAAPPEDCGGVWGYADLVEVLSDSANPEHRDRLEWLGLDDATEFAPERFDAEAVTRALSALRR
jgi:hypothetical protein